MKITLLTVGKLKEKYWQLAVAEYLKRLSAYAKVEIIEVADEKTPEGAKETVYTQIKNREGERLLERIPEDAYTVALAILGKQLSSEELAKKVESLGVYGTSHIVFIIGGSLGLSDAVLRRADCELSFSRMTFPHQMMRVILLEQLYRSYRIINHEPYHK